MRATVIGDKVRFDIIGTTAGTFHIQKFVDHGTGDGYQVTTHLSLPTSSLAMELGEALSRMALALTNGGAA